MVIELQTERRKLNEAMNARDAVVQRLVDAYESILQKSVLIEHLQQKIQQEPRGDSPFPFKADHARDSVGMKDEITRMESIIKDLRDEMKRLKDAPAGLLKPSDPPPSYDEGGIKVRILDFTNWDTTEEIARHRGRFFYQDYRRSPTAALLPRSPRLKTE